MCASWHECCGLKLRSSNDSWHSSSFMRFTCMTSFWPIISHVTLPWCNSIKDSPHVGWIHSNIAKRNNTFKRTLQQSSIVQLLSNPCKLTLAAPLLTAIIEQSQKKQIVSSPSRPYCSTTMVVLREQAAREYCLESSTRPHWNPLVPVSTITRSIPPRLPRTFYLRHRRLR